MASVFDVSESEGGQRVPMLLESSLPRPFGGLWYPAMARERHRLEAIEELMRLRRWREAAGLLEGLLSQPMRSPQARIQALVFLAALLARFHRFADAIAVYDYLLQFDFQDAEMTHGLRLGRAMSLLHEERLFDADRAINELRRNVARASRPWQAPNALASETPTPQDAGEPSMAQATAETPAPRGRPSAGLCLVEIYRDVKTGHPREAVELFEKNLPAMRKQLGHRIADAWALIARAFDLLGRGDEARAAYENATLLAEPDELKRRYVEVAALAEKYPPAARPASCSEREVASSQLPVASKTAESTPPTANRQPPAPLATNNWQLATAAEAAIARIRRDLVLTSAVKWGLAGAALLAAVVEAATTQQATIAPMLLALIGGLWLLLSYRSVRGSRLAAISPMLIAAGEYDEAEQHIDQAMRSFSMFRAVKLQSLHHLAMLRHAQQRWAESALLCRALLKEKLGMLRGMQRSARLMLADALAETGDLPGTYQALSALYNQRLPLGEALELLAVQMDYMAAAGQWAPMLQGAGKRVQMAELMPAGRAARTEALLALAARKTGQAELEAWLRKRVELISDVDELARQRPIIGELWSG